MATELHDKLTFINEEKNKKILPENIKKGIKIFNVEGVADVLDTSDANATASDLLQGKSAYVQGTKIEGTIPSIENLEVTPEIETETQQVINSYVGTIKVPSILDAAASTSDINLKYNNMAGGTRAASATVTVNTVPGGMLVACIYYRTGKALTGEGWTLIARNTMVTSEGWYQWAEVLTKPTTGTSETITISIPGGSDRCAIGVLSYDTICPLELITDYVSGPTRVSKSSTLPDIQIGDILVAHNFWTSQGVYVGGVSTNVYRKCGDGGRLLMATAASNSTSGYFYNDNSSELGGMVVRLKPGLTAEDIKVGRKILGLTGTFTGDADATAADIMTGKTAYVNGVKVTGDIATLGEEVQVTATDTQVSEDNTKFIVSSETPSSGVLTQGATYQITANGNQVMGALGLAPDMLRAGINILGIEGSYGADASEFAAKYETSGRTAGLTPLTMITSIQHVNMEGVVDASGAFQSLTYLKSLPEMNLDMATSMSNLCQYDTNLIYMPNLSIPKVTTIAYAFRNCNNIAKINLTNTNSLHTFTCAFENCTALSVMPNLNYNSAYYMFGAFNNSGISGNIDMSGFTKSGAVMTFNNMYMNCHNVITMSSFNKQGTAQLNMPYMFQNCQNLTSIDNCNFFNVNYMSGAFRYCSNLRSITNTGFSYVFPCVYSEVQDKGYIFTECRNLTTLDNNFWINFHARGMNDTFTNCENLEFPDHIVMNIHGNNFYYGGLTNTFKNCRKLKSVEIIFPTYYYASSYNYSPYFNNTFNGCTNLHTVIINNLRYNNVGSLLSGQPFTNCPNLTNIQFVNFTHFNTYYQRPYWAGVAAGSGITSINNITGINLFNTFSGLYMFANCHNLYDLGEEYLNFFNMTSMAYMFLNCYNLKTLNYSQININKVQNTQGAFWGCNGMTHFNDWYFAAVTMTNHMFENSRFNVIENLHFPVTQHANRMFANANVGTLNNIVFNAPNGYSLMTGLQANIISNIIMPNSTIANYCFSNVEANELKDLDMGKVVNAQGMFQNSYIGYAYNLNLSGVKNAYTMFSGARSINIIPLINFTNVNNVCYLFSNIHMSNITNLNLTIGTARAYYLFQSSPDLKEVRDVNLYINNTETAYMFQNCQNLTTIQNFTMSNLGNMYMAFNWCTNLTTVENVNMPFVQYAYYMFANCHNLRSVVNLNVPMMTLGTYMFYNCTNLTTAPAINTVNFTSMEYMYQACSNLTDIPLLDCDNLTSCYTMLGVLPNLQNCGGFINLGKGFANARGYNYMYNMYLNYYPNLTQQSLFNIIDNLYTTTNYQYIFMLTNQYYMLDANYRTKLQNEKHRYIQTVSK